MLDLAVLMSSSKHQCLSCPKLRKKMILRIASLGRIYWLLLCRKSSSSQTCNVLPLQNTGPPWFLWSVTFMRITASLWSPFLRKTIIAEFESSRACIYVVNFHVVNSSHCTSIARVLCQALCDLSSMLENEKELKMDGKKSKGSPAPFFGPNAVKAV